MAEIASKSDKFMKSAIYAIFSKCVNFRNCPSSRQQTALRCSNQNSKTTFIVQIFPKFCLYGFYSWICHFWALFWPYFSFCDFLGQFRAIFPFPRGGGWHPFLTAKEVLKSKKWRKQTHNRIQFWVLGAILAGPHCTQASRRSSYLI